MQGSNFAPCWATKSKSRRGFRFVYALIRNSVSALLLQSALLGTTSEVQAARDVLLERALSRYEGYLLTTPGEISMFADRPTGELLQQLPLYQNGQQLSEHGRKKLIASRSNFVPEAPETELTGAQNVLLEWSRNTGAWKNIYPAYEMGNADAADGAEGGGGTAQYHRLEQVWNPAPADEKEKLSSSTAARSSSTRWIVHAYTVQLGNGRMNEHGMPLAPPQIFAVFDPLDKNKRAIREWWLNPTPVKDAKGDVLTWKDPVQVGRLKAEWVDAEGNAVWPYEDEQPAPAVQQKPSARTTPPAGEAAEAAGPSAMKKGGLLLKRPKAVHPGQRSDKATPPGVGAGGIDEEHDGDRSSGRNSPSPPEGGTSTSSTASLTASSPEHEQEQADRLAADDVDEEIGNDDDFDSSTEDDSPMSSEDGPTGTTSDSEEDEVDFADGGQEQLQTPARSASAAKAAISDDAYGDHERESKLIMQKAMAIKLDWEWFHVSRKKRNRHTAVEEDIKGLELLSDLRFEDAQPGYLVPWTYQARDHAEVDEATKSRPKKKGRKASLQSQGEFGAALFEPPIPGVDTFEDGAIMFRGRLWKCLHAPRPSPHTMTEASYYWHSRILAKWFEGTNNMKSSAVSPTSQRKQRTTCKWLPHTPKERAKPLRGGQVVPPRRIAAAQFRKPELHLFRKRLHDGEYPQSDNASWFWDAPNLEQLYANAPTKRPKSTASDELLREPKPFVWRKILYFNEVGRWIAPSGSAGKDEVDPAFSSLESLLLQRIRGKEFGPSGSAAAHLVQSQLALLEPKLTASVFTKTGIPAAMRRVLVLDGVWNPWYASRGLTLGGPHASLYDQCGDAMFAHLRTVRLFGRPLSVASVSASSAEGSPGLSPATLGAPSSTASDLIFVDSSRARHYFKRYGGKRYLYLIAGDDYPVKDNGYGYSIDAAVMQLAHSFFDIGPKGRARARAPARARGAAASNKEARWKSLFGDFVQTVSRRGSGKNFGYLVSDGNYDWRPGPTQFHMFSAAALVSKHVFGHPLSGDSVRALKAYQVEENFLCAPSVLCAELHGILFALRTLKAWWRTASADQRAAQFSENEATSAAKFMKDMDPLLSSASMFSSRHGATMTSNKRGRKAAASALLLKPNLQTGDRDEDGSTHRPTTHVPLLTDSSHSIELLRTYFKHGFQLRTASNDEQHSFFHAVAPPPGHQHQESHRGSPAHENYRQAAGAARARFVEGQGGLLAYRGVLRQIASEWLSLLEDRRVLVFFHWVPGHAGYLPNELVDSAAAKLRSVARAVGRAAKKMGAADRSLSAGEALEEEQKAIADECTAVRTTRSGSVRLADAAGNEDTDDVDSNGNRLGEQVHGIVRKCVGHLFKAAALVRMEKKLRAERHGGHRDGAQPRAATAAAAAPENMEAHPPPAVTSTSSSTADPVPPPSDAVAPPLNSDLLSGSAGVAGVAAPDEIMKDAAQQERDRDGEDHKEGDDSAQVAPTPFGQLSENQQDQDEVEDPSHVADRLAELNLCDEQEAAEMKVRTVEMLEICPDEQEAEGEGVEGESAHAQEREPVSASNANKAKIEILEQGKNLEKFRFGVNGAMQELGAASSEATTWVQALDRMRAAQESDSIETRERANGWLSSYVNENPDFAAIAQSHGLDIDFEKIQALEKYRTGVDALLAGVFESNTVVFRHWRDAVHFAESEMNDCKEPENGRRLRQLLLAFHKTFGERNPQETQVLLRSADETAKQAGNLIDDALAEDLVDRALAAVAPASQDQQGPVVHDVTDSALALAANHEEADHETPTLHEFRLGVNAECGLQLQTLDESLALLEEMALADPAAALLPGTAEKSTLLLCVMQFVDRFSQLHPRFGDDLQAASAIAKRRRAAKASAPQPDGGDVPDADQKQLDSACEEFRMGVERIIFGNTDAAAGSKLKSWQEAWELVHYVDAVKPETNRLRVRLKKFFREGILDKYPDFRRFALDEWWPLAGSDPGCKSSAQTRAWFKEWAGGGGNLIELLELYSQFRDGVAKALGREVISLRELRVEALPPLRDAVSQYFARWDEREGGALRDGDGSLNLCPRKEVRRCTSPKLQSFLRDFLGANHKIHNVHVVHAVVDFLSSMADEKDEQESSCLSSSHMKTLTPSDASHAHRDPDPPPPEPLEGVKTPSAGCLAHEQPQPHQEPGTLEQDCGASSRSTYLKSFSVPKSISEVLIRKEKVLEKLNRAREQDNARWSFVLDHLEREQQKFADLLDYTRAAEWWSSSLPGNGAVEVLSSPLFNNMVRRRRERRDRMEAFAEAQAYKMQTLQDKLQQYLHEENRRTNAAIQDMNAWARDRVQLEVGSEGEPLLRSGGGADLLRRLEEIVAEKRARDSKKTPSGKTALECGIEKSSIDVNLAEIRSNLEKPLARPIDVKNRLKEDIFAQRSLDGLTHQRPTDECLKGIGLQVFSDPSRKHVEKRTGPAWRWFANPIDRLAAEAELRETHMADGFAALRQEGGNLARLGLTLNADESGDSQKMFMAGVQDLMKAYHVFLVEADELHRGLARERILLDLALFDDYKENPHQPTKLGEGAGGGAVYSKNKSQRRMRKDAEAARKDAIAADRAMVENEYDSFVHSRLSKVVEEAAKQLREVFWPGIAFIDSALVKAGSASEEGGVRAKLTEMQLRKRQELFVQVRQHFERARGVLANELTDPDTGRSALWKTMDLQAVLYLQQENVLSAYEYIAQSTAAWWASEALSDEEDNESEQAEGSEHGEADHKADVDEEDYHGDEVEAERAGGGDHGDDQDGAGEHDVKDPGGHGHRGGEKDAETRQQEQDEGRGGDGHGPGEDVDMKGHDKGHRAEEQDEVVDDHHQRQSGAVTLPGSAGQDDPPAVPESKVGSGHHSGKQEPEAPAPKKSSASGFASLLKGKLLSSKPKTSAFEAARSGRPAPKKSAADACPTPKNKDNKDDHDKEEGNSKNEKWLLRQMQLRNEVLASADFANKLADAVQLRRRKWMDDTREALLSVNNDSDSELPVKLLRYTAMKDILDGVLQPDIDALRVASRSLIEAKEAKAVRSLTQAQELVPGAVVPDTPSAGPRVAGGVADDGPILKGMYWAEALEGEVEHVSLFSKRFETSTSASPVHRDQDNARPRHLDERSYGAITAFVALESFLHGDRWARFLHLFQTLGHRAVSRSAWPTKPPEVVGGDQNHHGLLLDHEFDVVEVDKNKSSGSTSTSTTSGRAAAERDPERDLRFADDSAVLSSAAMHEFFSNAHVDSIEHGGEKTFQKYAPVDAHREELARRLVHYGLAAELSNRLKALAKEMREAMQRVLREAENQNPAAVDSQGLLGPLPATQHQTSHSTTSHTETNVELLRYLTEKLLIEKVVLPLRQVWDRTQLPPHADEVLCDLFDRELVDHTHYAGATGVFETKVIDHSFPDSAAEMRRNKDNLDYWLRRPSSGSTGRPSSGPHARGPDADNVDEANGSKKVGYASFSRLIPGKLAEAEQRRRQRIVSTRKDAPVPSGGRTDRANAKMVDAVLQKTVDAKMGEFSPWTHPALLYVVRRVTARFMLWVDDYQSSASTLHLGFDDNGDAQMRQATASTTIREFYDSLRHADREQLGPLSTSAFASSLRLVAGNDFSAVGGTNYNWEFASGDSLDRDHIGKHWKHYAVDSVLQQLWTGKRPITDLTKRRASWTSFPHGGVVASSSSSSETRTSFMAPEGSTENKLFRPDEILQSFWARRDNPQALPFPYALESLVAGQDLFLDRYMEYVEGADERSKPLAKRKAVPLFLQAAAEAAAGAREDEGAGEGREHEQRGSTDLPVFADILLAMRRVQKLYSDMVQLQLASRDLFDPVRDEMVRREQDERDEHDQKIAADEVAEAERRWHAAAAAPERAAEVVARRDKFEAQLFAVAEATRRSDGTIASPTTVTLAQVRDAYRSLVAPPTSRSTSEQEHDRVSSAQELGSYLAAFSPEERELMSACLVLHRFVLHLHTPNLHEVIPDKGLAELLAFDELQEKRPDHVQERQRTSVLETAVRAKALSPTATAMYRYLPKLELAFLEGVVWPISEEVLLQLLSEHVFLRDVFLDFSKRYVGGAGGLEPSDEHRLLLQAAWGRGDVGETVGACRGTTRTLLLEARHLQNPMGSGLYPPPPADSDVPNQLLPAHGLGVPALFDVGPTNAAATSGSSEGFRGEGQGYSRENPLEAETGWLSRLVTEQIDGAVKARADLLMRKPEKEAAAGGADKAGVEVDGEDIESLEVTTSEAVAVLQLQGGGLRLRPLYSEPVGFSIQTIATIAGRNVFLKALQLRENEKLELGTRMGEVVRKCYQGKIREQYKFRRYSTLQNVAKSPMVLARESWSEEGLCHWPHGDKLFWSTHDTVAALLSFDEEMANLSALLPAAVQ